tara:strand:+ start:94 stop:315 length:222 start_codon:yes stop_codon:yes gene_type:complete
MKKWIRMDIELKPNEMEFIDEIATQLTELNFHEDTFENYRGEGEIHFKKHAQNFYNERYDEIENLYITLIKNK